MANDLNAYDDQLLLEYIEGELSPHRRAEVEQMMRADGHLALMVRQLIRDRNELRELYEPTPPGWVMEEVEQTLERSMLFGGSQVDGQRFQRQNRHALGVVVVAGTLAAVLAVVGSVLVALVMSAGDTPDEVARHQPPPSIEQGMPEIPPVVVIDPADPVPPVVGVPSDPADPSKTPVPPVADPSVPPPQDKPPVVPPAVVQQTDPVKPPLDTHGQVDPVAPRNLIRLAPHLTQSPRFIEELVAVLARSPALADETELHLLGQEPAQIYRRLSEFVEKKPAVEPTAPIRVRLSLSPQQLAQQLALLRSDPNLKSQWYLGAGVQNLLGKPVPLALDPWPAVRPDYSQILERLLAESTASPGLIIQLPVVIDRAGLSAAPTTAPEQDPALQVIDQLIRQLDEAPRPATRPSAP